MAFKPKNKIAVAETSPVDAVVEAVKARPLSTAKEKELQAAQDKVVLDSVVDVDASKVVNKLAAAGLEVSKSLDGIRNTVSELLRIQTDLSGAITLKRAEMEELHNKDVVASDLALLVAQHAKTKEELALQLEEEREAIEDERADFEEEKRLSRLTWDRDVLREREAHSYARDNERRLDADTYKQHRLQQDRDNAFKQSQLESSWAVRENELKAREVELVDLRKKVAEFPVEVKKEVDRAVAIATSAAKKDLTHTHELEKKDYEGRIAILLSEREALNRQLLAANKALETLEARLAESDARTTTIATAALASAGNLNAMNEQRTMTALAAQSSPKKQ